MSEGLCEGGDAFDFLEAGAVAFFSGEEFEEVCAGFADELFCLGFAVDADVWKEDVHASSLEKLKTFCTHYRRERLELGQKPLSL